ncbi:MAG: aldo/keto reductase family protein [Candidatus Eremiobacteraeota bacterium]|nr:aldo/keto reductase family protein [Candidatus Eremiobacteraeota bacterium]
MKFRTLGHSGLHLSTVGLGSWLTYGSTVERDTARACVLRAWELGVNFIDTANVYARGAAEEVLGPVLQELDRDALVLATKVYFPMGDTPNERGLSRKHIRNQIDRSLQRLRTEYVDLYQCHRFDTATPLEETCEAMNDLVRSGKILYWGTSEWNADQLTAAVTLARANSWAVPISNQPQYSALWPRIEDRVLPTCERYGIGNVVWSPLAMGILTGKYTDAKHPPAGTRAAGGNREMMEDYFTQPVLDAVQRLVPIAQEHECTLAQLALAWCLRQAAVTSVIVGATKPAHVVDNVAAADLELDASVFAEVDRVLGPVAAHEPHLA